MIAGAVNITVDSAGALLNGTGVASNAQNPFSPPNNPTANLNFLNAEISLWNGAFNPDLPAAIGPVALNNEGLTGNSFIAPGGFNYVVFHFGAGQAGGGGVSPGGWWQAFNLGGVGGTFNAPSVGGDPVGGFSSARFFNPVSSPVPDGGTTLMLLGSALVCLGALRRRFA